jgi:adenosylhomocysteinase
MARLAQHYALEIARERFTDSAAAASLLHRYGDGHPIVVVDMGGYFTSVADDLARPNQRGLLGVVEDTENGHQRYDRAALDACPVVSVARSPLKNREDFLVGQSIVFSAEALLRERGDILHGRTACVIGYGKLGRSIANLLHARHVRTVVYDLDPVRRIEAMSHGFPVTHLLEPALQRAGLVFCATGNMALRRQHFALLNNNAYIATVRHLTTSWRSKIFTSFTEWKEYRRITSCSRGNHRFYLMNHGQAVNFIHGAAVGPFIYLIQAEPLASLARLSHGGIAPGITENDSGLRAQIAQIWLDHFGSH